MKKKRRKKDEVVLIGNALMLTVETIRSHNVSTVNTRHPS